MKTRIVVACLGLIGLPVPALADTGERAGDAGLSAIWVLANFCYAGMRAQSHPSTGWRIVAFIFGFPGTLVSMLVIEEGSERAYGVDMPSLHRVGTTSRTPSA